MNSKTIHRPKVARERGELKIFLGAVPGVGKTYRMLSEAKDRIARGEDIVVGLVEPHGRPATAAMAEGLEQVPTRTIEYRGASFQELDVRAILRRRPEVVIVDELAHTNIPGSKNEKRWQDIEELRDSGIDVVTTLNVQHLESLNDTVEGMTSVRVRETLPDAIFASAEDIELVDLTADALIDRLMRGEIYHEETIPQALSRFFRKENIVALRELALRQMAEGVDAQLQDYVGERKKKDRAIREHVVVCVTPTPRALRLIRRAYRFARGMQGAFDCITVGTPGVRLEKKEAEQWEAAKKMATELGANVLYLEGDNPADEIARYINRTGTTLLVLGETGQSRWSEVLKGSVINRISRQVHKVDIIVIATDSNESPLFDEEK